MEVDESVFADAHPINRDIAHTLRVTHVSLRIKQHKDNNIYISTLSVRGEAGEWLKGKRINVDIAGESKQWLRLIPAVDGNIEPYVLKGTPMVALREVPVWPKRALYAPCDWQIKGDILYIKLDDDWQQMAQWVDPDVVLRAMLREGIVPRNRPSRAKPSPVAPAPLSVDEPFVENVLEVNKPAQPAAKKTKPQPKKQVGTIPITTDCPGLARHVPKLGKLTGVPVKNTVTAKPGKLALQYMPSARFDKTKPEDWQPNVPADSPVVSNQFNPPPPLDNGPPLPPDARPGSFWFNGKLIQPKTAEEMEEIRKQKTSTGPTFQTLHQQNQEKELGKRGNAARFGEFKRS